MKTTRWVSGPGNELYGCASLPARRLFVVQSWTLEWLRFLNIVLFSIFANQKSVVREKMRSSPIFFKQKLSYSLRKGHPGVFLSRETFLFNSIFWSKLIGEKVERLIFNYKFLGVHENIFWNLRNICFYFLFLRLALKKLTWWPDNLLQNDGFPVKIIVLGKWVKRDAQRIS